MKWRRNRSFFSGDSLCFFPGPTNPSADPDNDGLSVLLEHALGTSDTDPRSGPAAITLPFEGAPNPATFSHLVNLRANNLVRIIESSTDLLNWSPESSAQLSERSNDGNGSEIRSWIIPQTSPKQFFRLKISR